MNEKYGIELQLIMQKFNEKIDRVKNAFKGIENKKIDMSKQVKIDNVARQFEIASNEAEMLRNKLKTLNLQMSQMQDWQIGTQSYNKLQNEIDKTSMRFQKAAAKVDNLNDKLNLLESTDSFKKLKNEAKSFNEMNTGVNQLTKGIDKVTSKIKRFALSLFSIRSIYALVSKASTAYLSQDTALADKLQAVWVRATVHY